MCKTGQGDKYRLDDYGSGKKKKEAKSWVYREKRLLTLRMSNLLKYIWTEKKGKVKVNKVG